MIQEEPPRTADDLNYMIGDFITNNIKFDKKDSKVVTDKLYEELNQKKLISTEGSLTWVAEKLDQPLIMNKVELITELEEEHGYTKTPFTFDRFTHDNNAFIDGDSLNAKAEAKAQEKRQKINENRKAKEALVHRKHLAQMIEMKNMLPAIEMSRDAKRGSMDIRLDDVNLEVPGKQLLDMTSVILGSGRKYGLIGKNGIGKTTLLYAMCRKEIKGMENLGQILLVEQEIEGDDRTVIETV